MWLLTEVYAFAYENSETLKSMKSFVEGYAIPIILLILLISILLAAPKLKVSRKLFGTDINIIIEFCDIWKMEGAKVISGVDTFDSDINKGLVSVKTLHGHLIENYYDGKPEEFDKDVSDFMKTYNIEPITTDSKLPGKNKRYEIGTSVILRPKDQYIYFMALSSMKNKGVVEIKPAYIDKSLENLWIFIEEFALEYNDVINIPVIGTGKKKLPAIYTNQFLLYKIVESFVRKVKLQPFCRTLRICLYHMDFDKYDLNKIQNYLDDYANEYLLKK